MLLAAATSCPAVVGAFVASPPAQRHTFGPQISRISATTAGDDATSQSTEPISSSHSQAPVQPSSPPLDRAVERPDAGGRDDVRQRNEAICLEATSLGCPERDARSHQRHFAPRRLQLEGILPFTRKGKN